LPKLLRMLEGQIVARQLVRAATGTAANYRAACRSRSRAEFIARIGVAAEEADESHLWLDLTQASSILDDPQTNQLLKEASELTAIFTTSRNTAKANQSRKKSAKGNCCAAVERGTGFSSGDRYFLAILAIPAFLAIRRLEDSPGRPNHT